MPAIMKRAPKNTAKIIPAKASALRRKPGKPKALPSSGSKNALPPQKKQTLSLKESNKTEKEIHFYRSNEKPYGAFSNLFRRKIVFEGQEYETAEHAYQAGKARKEKVREWILSAPSPSLLAMAAHGLYSWDIVPNWSSTKYDRMRAVLHAKFSQHDDLAALLVATNDARLVETGTVKNVVNTTWGEVNGEGKNMLGNLLMEVRETLARQISKASQTKEKKQRKQPTRTGR
jgi:ribA/ribD-fused uncharacterized protein